MCVSDKVYVNLVRTYPTSSSYLILGHDWDERTKAQCQKTLLVFKKI